MSRSEMLYTANYCIANRDSCMYILSEFDTFLDKMALNHKWVQSRVPQKHAGPACGPK